MDVDSTLIDEEVIDLLGMAAGVGERITTITDHAMCGELDFAGSLKARVKLLRGLPVSAFDKVYAEVHFTRGTIDLINELHRHGWKVGVVSGVSMTSSTVWPVRRTSTTGWPTGWEPRTECSQARSSVRS